MRIRSLVAILLAVAAGLVGGSRSAKAAEPTLEVRVQSVNVLLDKAEYVAGLAGKEDVIQSVKLILKNLQMEGKGIEGVDPQRPFGLYATLSTDVIGSPVIAMVPIADQDRFLAMLRDRLNITPEKMDGGALKVELPDGVKNPVVGALYLRFANDYLYVARSVKDLDSNGLIAPKTFFAKDDGAVASAIMRGDRIPVEVKTFIVGQMELALAEQRRKAKATGKSVAELAGEEWGADSVIRVTKALLEDSKELALRVFIDAKADELSAEVVIVPKTGTASAKYVSSLGGRMSLSAGIVAAKDAVARTAVKFALPTEARASFSKVVDSVLAQAVKDAGDEGRVFAERVAKVLSPTLKAGELEMAAALLGPDAKGRHTLLAAMAVKDGKEIEKLAKDFAVFAGGAADITFDIEKIGDFNLHKVVLNDVPEPFEAIFGTKTIWVAVSDTHVAVSVEPEGAAIRAGLKAKPAPVPILSVEVSLAKLLPLVAKDLKPDEVKALLRDAFGSGGTNGKDTVTITITGGQQLTAKAKLKGKGVRLLAGADLFKKK